MIAKDQPGGRPLLDRLLPPQAGLLDRWESLRFVYNAVLVAETALLTVGGGPHAWTTAGFWRHLLTLAFLANLCYLAGPLIEVYFHRASPTTARFTLGFFVLGTTFAMLLTFLLLRGWGSGRP